MSEQPRRTICVYCASSRRVDPAYLDAARALGETLARADRRVIYGGGGTGLMGALADGALAAGGKVVGVIPDFLREQELAHPGLREILVVPDMHERKRRMLEAADAFVALPGGCGTFEELFEALTWKRLGLHRDPIVIVNLRGYFDPCLALLGQAVRERFMDPRHARLWTVVREIGEVLPAIDRERPFPADALSFAAP